MDKNLADNDIPDETDELISLGIDLEDYIPAIHLYFNDDLTIAWFIIFIALNLFILILIFQIIKYYLNSHTHMIMQQESKVLPHPSSTAPAPPHQARPLPKIVGSPSTVFIGDLPKDVTQVELYDYLREIVGGDFELVLKRWVS